MRFIWKIIQLELPQRDLEAILNTPVIYIFYISLRHFTFKTWTWVRLIFSRTKPWVGQFLKNRLFQGLNLKTHLEIGENKRFEAFMKVEIRKPSLVNAGRFWAGFGGLNHVSLGSANFWKTGSFKVWIWRRTSKLVKTSDLKRLWRLKLENLL